LGGQLSSNNTPLLRGNNRPRISSHIQASNEFMLAAVPTQDNLHLPQINS